MNAMPPAASGLVWCLVFVALDAAQAVYLGGVLQGVDGFLLGLLVFGSAALGCGIWARARRPAEVRLAFRHGGDLAALNLCNGLAWASYFLAVQLIEPAVAFTLFSGAIPLTTMAAARLGFRGAEGARNGVERTGNAVLTLGMALLAAITLLGLSGFVRGGPGVAGFGVLLALLAGVLITGMLLYSHRLDRAGVGPTAQFALRFPFYLALAAAGWLLGLDAKPGVAALDLAVAWAIGLAVLAFPIYAVQKAISLSSPLTIAAAAAATPAVVFLLQMIEGRVAYSGATLIGLAVYMLGALMAALGGLRAIRRSRDAAARLSG